MGSRYSIQWQRITYFAKDDPGWGKVFGLTIKDGWVDSIMELPNQTTEPEDDFALEASEPEDGEDEDFGDEEEEEIPF